MTIQLPDDAFIAATRALLRAESEQDLEFVFSPEAANFNDFYVRTLNYYTSMVPWIEEVFPLRTARVLEIGFGSGASTLAVAHKCATIDAFDIEASSYRLVADKVEFYGLSNVKLETLDPEWAKSANISAFLHDRECQYDVILLAAVIEHMTLEERLEALKALWRLLRPGGIMVVYDTPNRLYPFDIHSFQLPFFDWLPEDLAIRYANRSPRASLPQTLEGATDKKLTLYRIGRGASYHEFDLAIGLENLTVMNDGYSRHITHRKTNTVYEGFLAGVLNEFAPNVAPGFGKAFLELVLGKKWEAVTIIAREGVVDDISPLRRSYTRLEHINSKIEAAVTVEHAQTKIIVDVLKHAWSGTLVFADDKGNEFHSENLYSNYQRETRIEATLPSGCRTIRLGLRPSEGSNGMQAWIFGIGSA